MCQVIISLIKYYEFQDKHLGPLQQPKMEVMSLIQYYEFQDKLLGLLQQPKMEAKFFTSLWRWL